VISNASPRPRHPPKIAEVGNQLHLVLNAEHKHVFMYLVKPICQEHLQAALKACQECHCTESNEPSEGDEKMVFIGPASESFGRAPYREHSRPPYRQLPR